jgi:hypothetical protein
MINNNIVKDVNFLSRINSVKIALIDAKLKKSGKNNFSGFEYYELSDISPTLERLCQDNKIFLHFSFTESEGILTIFDCESEKSLSYKSPSKSLTLKGCNEIQALGGVQTYLRRYLIFMAFNITEPDLFDKNVGNKDFNERKEVKKVGGTQAIDPDEVVEYKELVDFIANANSLEELEILVDRIKEASEGNKSKIRGLFAERQKELKGGLNV